MEAEDESKTAAVTGEAEVGETAAAGEGAAEGGDGQEWEDDPELDALKKKVKQMQEEAEGACSFVSCPLFTASCAALERIQQQAEQSTGEAGRERVRVSEAG